MFPYQPTAPCRRYRQPRRRGAAIVELAVCLPIVLLLAVAAYEATNLIYAQQSLKIASYEAARVAALPESNSERVVSHCQQLLKSRDVAEATIRIEPTDLATVEPGKFIQVTLTAPCSANTVIGSWFFGHRELDASVSLMKEYR